MLRDIRREQIYKHLLGAKNATIEELANLFSVTRETIRSDLTFLENQGLAARTFGGALLKEDPDPPLAQRIVSQYEEKRKIAQAALQFIKNRDTIVMDAGSTIIELSHLLPMELEAVVVSNSLEIITHLSRYPSVTAVAAGGVLRKRSLSFSGRSTENIIRSYNLNKAFLSCPAISIGEGVMDTNEGEADVKRAIVDSAKEITILADHTKFDQMAIISVFGIERVHRIITDDLADPKLLEPFRKLGIEIIIAK